MINGDHIMSEERSNLCGISVVIPHSTNLPQEDVGSPLSMAPKIIPQQADTDDQLIGLWLHGRSVHTQKAYRRDLKLFRDHCTKNLKEVLLIDLHNFADILFQKALAPASIKRILSSIKSLYSWGFRIGYFQFDVGKPLRIPSSKDTLSNHILSESEVQTLFQTTTNPRNRLMLKVFYYTGLRLSELASLKYKDLQPRDKSGQLCVMTKGSKTNVLLLPEFLWNELVAYRGGKSEEEPVFQSRKGGHLCPGQIERIVAKIGRNAKISKSLYPHLLRHAHATHALSNGCPIHLVQKQLNHSSISTTGRYLHCQPQQTSAEYLK
jgi:integrase/recombinase XerD